MSLRGPKDRGNLLRCEQAKPSAHLRLFRSARNDPLRIDVFYGVSVIQSQDASDEIDRQTSVVHSTDSVPGLRVDHQFELPIGLL